MSPLELVAVALGLANIVLLVRRSIWNYPFGLAMVTLYAAIFAQAKLYSDAILQVFFFAVQLYGWANWARTRADAGEVVVRLMPAGARWLWVGTCLVLTALWGALMHGATDAAYPWWDAAVAVFSIAAQILLARRFVENWVLWIAVDVLAIGLYAARGLGLTAALYGVFLLLSAAGLRQWARALDGQR